MFQFLFKYPLSTWSRSTLVLLGAWPVWALWLAIVVAGVGIGLRVRATLPPGAFGHRALRGTAIGALQTGLAALLLLILWQPALTLTELKPQQDIIAFLVDDSASMARVEGGTTRLAKAVEALGGGVLTAVEKRFQVRLYRFDRQAVRMATLAELKGGAPVTRIGDTLKQFVQDTQELPIGAIVLVSDGSDNTGGIDADTIGALRSRHIPVHTVGIGAEHPDKDVEIDEATVAPRALARSRIATVVRFHQFGYARQKAKLVVRDGSSVLASREVTLGNDGETQAETVLFNVGDAGARALTFAVDPLTGEESTANNAVTRLVNVESDKRRVLYVEGEPRWEYKFIRRAEDDDRFLQLVSMLRTTENKIYRQGIDDGKELAEGFPTKANDLFQYQALIIGSVEATYFTPVQRQLIREFVDRRGGGLLLTGGRAGLGDGGWGASSVADLLPVVLPDSKGAFHADPATVELAAAGADSHVTRLVDDPAGNVKRWKTLPYLMDYQDPGAPKAGATVLAEMLAGGRKMPLLITQNFGRGRVAVLGTSGTWRWQMNLPVGDPSFGAFWQQLMRWLVTGAPGHVAASVPQQMLFDAGTVTLSADVRGDDYQPVGDARVNAHVIGPAEVSADIELAPVADTPGTFQAEWRPPSPGSYLTEVVAHRGDQPIGRDVLTFQRVDGVAEAFHAGQNRDLLMRLAAQTGGRHWRPEALADLPDEVALSNAGVTTRETKPLWNMPAFLLALVLLKSAEWLLRRKWGVV